MKWHDDQDLLEYIREWAFWTIRIDKEADDDSGVLTDSQIIDRMSNKTDFIAHSRIMMDVGVTAKQAAEIGLRVSAREKLKEAMQRRMRREDESDDISTWLK